jgi:Tfp pilus assembly protein PilO
MSKNSQEGGQARAGERRGDWLRQAVPLLITVLALVNALFFGLVLRPAGARASAAREGMRQLQDEVKSRRATVAHLGEIESKLGEARSEDVSFYQQKFLPRATGFSTVMEELEKLAVASHVKRGGANWSLTDVPDRPDLSAVEITTTMEGDYAGIVQFVNRVERDPLFLLIDQVSAVGGAPPPGQTLASNAPRSVRLAIRLITYFRG